MTFVISTVYTCPAVVCVCGFYFVERKGNTHPAEDKKKREKGKEKGKYSGGLQQRALILFVCCLLMSHFHRFLPHPPALLLVFPNVVVSRFLPFLLLKRRQVDLFYAVGHKQANIDLNTPRSLCLPPPLCSRFS